MDKFVKDGLVAVLVASDGFGHWSSFRDNKKHSPACIFDHEIVKLVLAKVDYRQIGALAKQKWPDGCWVDGDCLEVYFLPEGTEFCITGDSEGGETLRLKDEIEWQTA